MHVYLDNAATTPLDPQVLEAMMPFFTDNFGNPSSIHAYGRKAKAGIERARKTIANHLSASTGEIFFTSGGTESVNTAIKCAVMDLGVSTIITSPIEHHCVLHSVECMKQRHGVQVLFLSIDEKGNPSLDELDRLLLQHHGKKVLVSLMHANNEIGNVLDIEKVSEICKHHAAYFHSDTVQTIGHYKLNLQHTHIDFLSGAAHKFHGPKGVGFLYKNENLNIKPYMDGGAQERNMRAGTENISGIAGMAKALDIAMENLETDNAYIQGLKTYLAGGLMQLHPEIKIYGNYPDNSLYTILNVAIPVDMPGDMILFNLDIAEIAVSAGSACSSGSNTGSHVIKSLNKGDGFTSIRFSFSKFNTKEELDYVLQEVGKLIPSVTS